MPVLPGGVMLLDSGDPTGESAGAEAGEAADNKQEWC